MKGGIEMTRLKIFAQRLKQAREERNLTVRDLAESKVMNIPIRNLLDSGSSGHYARGGSTPPFRTTGQ